MAKVVFKKLARAFQLTFREYMKLQLPAELTIDCEIGFPILQAIVIGNLP
jgi:hypothetical protein